MACLATQPCDCCGKSIWINASKPSPYPLLCSDYCKKRHKLKKCERQELFTELMKNVEC